LRLFDFSTNSAPPRNSELLGKPWAILFFSTDHWNSGEVDLSPENDKDSSDDDSSDSGAEFGNYVVTPAAGMPREQVNPPETLSQRLQAAFDEVVLMSSNNIPTEPPADSEDVLGAVAATVEMRML
jgi:hypothetical protein